MGILMRAVFWGSWLAVLSLGVSAPRCAYSDLTDTQTYCVSVPAVLSCTSPAPLVLETHNEADGDFALTTQQWVSECNNGIGGATLFTLTQPFIHEDDATIKCDAGLTISIDNTATDALANWLVVGPVTVRTFYDVAVPINSATVLAVSTAAGNATFNVDVAFLTGEFSTIPAGKYETTVTATITAN